MKTNLSFLFFLVSISMAIILFSCESVDSIDPQPDIELNPDGLVFENVQERKSVTIKNKGNVPLDWDLRGESNYILASPFAGSLMPEEEVGVEIRLLVDQVPEGLIQSKLLLSTDKDIGREISIQILSSKADRWFLDFNIVDAVYDSIHDRLLALSGDKKLMILSPESKTVESISLDIQGIKLSLHPDGKSIVVGHEQAFSHINLENGQLIQRKVIPFPLFDLVLAGNNWVYLTRAEHTHTDIYCVNLDGWEADFSYWARTYGFTKIKLHPSGDYILATSTVLAPDDVIKYNIEEGWAKLLYDSPYHGDYQFGGDFWFTPSGDRFFARSGNIFHFSSQGSIDLTYITKLNAPNDFSFVAQSSKKGRIYSVHDVNLKRYYSVDDEPVLAIYDLSYTKTKERKLSKMIRFKDDLIEKALFEVPFGFFNKQQDTVYLLQKGIVASSGKEVWALESIAVD